MFFRILPDRLPLRPAPAPSILSARGAVVVPPGGPHPLARRSPALPGFMAFSFAAVLDAAAAPGGIRSFVHPCQFCENLIEVEGTGHGYWKVTSITSTSAFLAHSDGAPSSS